LGIPSNCDKRNGDLICFRLFFKAYHSVDYIVVPPTTTTTTPPTTTITTPPTTTTTTPPTTTIITPPTTTTESKPLIVINGGVFTPSPLRIAIGSTVEIENLDHNDHQIICDYPFTTNIIPEGTFDFIFDKAGTYTYWDEAAPLVKGTIVVS